ncbi:DUF1801 domain-containing protein [Aequorivita sp. Q41]|uniref:DUF1801 domain-containing protein n=1 Tax=Aequorivita sp. Q41 TaxID=3153300 RepID=UPI003241BBDC
MELIRDPRVESVFNSYPDTVKKQMRYLRKLVIDTASEIAMLEKMEETLKWGEPSYVTKHGSTLRMDWKEKTPNQYALYFKCTSKLVPSFKKLFKDKFNFEKDRAIVFELNDEVPEAELKQCITMALTYHKVKKLPLLGM